MADDNAVLCRITLPEREPHHSHIFVALREQVQVHLRDLRIVFALPEFFEFCAALRESEQDLRNYLAQNPQYEEQQQDPDVILAGAQRAHTPIRNSPRPNRSAYFANDLTVALSSADEVGVQWRDYRLALRRDDFALIAAAFRDAAVSLAARQPGRANGRPADAAAEPAASHGTGIRGVEHLPLTAIRSRFGDIAREWNHRDKPVGALVDNFRHGGDCFPILVSTEKDGSHHVIDGHHRLCAATIAQRETIPAIIAPITYADSEPLRKAESLLKAFDAAHGYRFETVGFGREWLAYKMNAHYRGHYARLVRSSLRGTLRRKLATGIRRALRSVGITRERVTRLGRVLGLR